MSALLPKADKAAEPSGCPLSAKSRHTHCSEANEASRVHHAARRCTHEPVAPPSRAWTPTQYNSSGDPANAIAIQGGFHVGYRLDYTTRGAWGRGARCQALGDSDALAHVDARKTFVLIHGAYHGGWCWRKGVDIRESRGHKVYAPPRT